MAKPPAPTLGDAIRTLAELLEAEDEAAGLLVASADARLCLALARLGEERWSPLEQRVLRRLAGRYRGLLESRGIDLDALPAQPEAESAPAAPTMPLPPLRARAANGARRVAAGAGERPPGAQRAPRSAREVLGPGGVIAQRLPGYE